jgi:hypothetical protein
VTSLVIKWREDQLHELLNSVDGPVGRLIAELSAEAAQIARSAVRVRSVPGTRRTRAGRGSSARPPGFLKADIRVHGPVRGSLGGLYGGVNAAADPAVFLEYPAAQMTRKYPFLTTALDEIVARY